MSGKTEIRYVESGVSVRTEIFRSWCVSENRNMYNLV